MKTNTLIFLSIALKQTKAGPRSSGTPFLGLHIRDGMVYQVKPHQHS